MRVVAGLVDDGAGLDRRRAESATDDVWSTRPPIRHYDALAHRRHQPPGSRIMPESPLIQIETSSLNDLEALIADRAKGESEIELGFGRRKDREKKEYQAASQQLDRDVQGRRRVPAGPSTSGSARRSTPSSSAIPRRSEDEYAEAKQQADDQFKKEQRRAKKTKDEAGWQALAFFEGTRDEGVKWRRGTEANWSAAIQDLHVNQETAEILLKRFGRMTVATPEEDDGHPGGLGGEDRRGARRPRAEAPVDPEATEGDAPRPRRTRRGQPADPPPDRPDPHRGRDHRPQRAEAPQVLATISDLDLAVPDPRRRRGRRAGPQSRLGWTDRPASRGASSRSPARSAPGSAWPRWPGPRCCATPSRSASSWPTPSRRSSRTRTGSRSTSSASSRSSRSGGRTRSARPRRPWPASSPRPSSAARSCTRRPTSSTPRYRAGPRAPRRAGKKVEEIYPAQIAARKEKYDADKKELDESYRKTKDATEQEYQRAWQTLIDDWTGGMGRIDEALRGVNEEAARRFLDWTPARPRRLEAARRRSRPACGSAASPST